MAVKFANNAYTTLSADINSSTTTIPVNGALKFPNLTLDGGGHHMYVSIIGASYVEIIKVTSSGVNSFTCLRAQEDTTGTAAVTGDRVELRVTAAMLNDATGDGDHASKGFATAMSIAL